MIYEDKDGNKWHDDEINMLAPWEIEELGIHVADPIGPERRVSQV